MVAEYNATAMVNAELDALAEKYGKKYARIVSAAFCGIQLYHACVVLHAHAKAGPGNSEMPMTPAESIDRVASHLSQILGIVSHKLSESERVIATDEAQRIYDTALAMASKSGHPVQ